jgi:hypothetical protein
MSAQLREPGREAQPVEVRILRWRVQEDASGAAVMLDVAGALGPDTRFFGVVRPVDHERPGDLGGLFVTGDSHALMAWLGHARWQALLTSLLTLPDGQPLELELALRPAGQHEDEFWIRPWDPSRLDLAVIGDLVVRPRVETLAS